MPTGGAAHAVEKEMALTHADFFRLLPRAVGTDAYEVVGDRVRIAAAGGGRVEIALGPETVRRIALLQIPSVRLKISFAGVATADAEAWLRRFDRTYQKGGG